MFPRCGLILMCRKHWLTKDRLASFQIYIFMSKRQRIFIAALLVVFFQSLVIKEASLLSWWWLVPMVCFLGAWFCLKIDLRGIRYFTVLFLPVYLGFIFSLVFRIYVFSPVFKYLLLGSFGLLYYTSLLTNNILNVSGFKIVPLSRAARTVNLLLTFICAFFGFSVFYKLHLPALIQLIFVFASSFLLGWQYLWSLDFKEKVSFEALRPCLFLAFLTTELAFTLSFLPIRVFVRALMLTIPIYFGLGVWTQIKQRKLLKSYLFEFAFVSLLSLFLSLFLLR